MSSERVIGVISRRTSECVLREYSPSAQSVVRSRVQSCSAWREKYFYGRRLGKNVVKIAVMDLGVGFQASLAPKYAAQAADWTDTAALRLAIFEGATRYNDPGRGQGLSAVRRFVERWHGKLMIRSGSARLGLSPAWDRTAVQQIDLLPFPGTQVSIVLPEL